jgi:hypothetical protein
MAKKATWELLVPRIRALAGAGGPDLDELTALLAPDGRWPLVSWRRLYLDLPFDEWSFDDRFGPSAWAQSLDNLERWCLSFADRPAVFRERHRDAFAFLGLLLLTLVALRESERRRLGSGEAHDCAGICGALAASEPVRAAIRGVYGPTAGSGATGSGATGPGAALPRTAWKDSVDFDTLTFHRHGTTSIILRGTSTAARGVREPFALKLIVLPFLRLPRIERSTSEYRQRYGSQDFDCRHLVRVWASSSSWILMDFVAGRPLADVDFGVRPSAPERPSWRGRHLGSGRRPEGAAGLNLRRLREYGLALFDALEEMDGYLNRAGPAGVREVHADLSPSNIIVGDDRGQPFLHLIDLGRNYLYLHALAGREGAESAFIAPEVREDDGQLGRADLYSVGQLIVLFSGVRPNADRTVPDELYARVPMVARLVEDLIDERPGQRLLLHGSGAGAGWRYGALRQVFAEVVDAAIAAETDGSAPSDEHWLRESWRLARRRALSVEVLRPLAGTPWRLFRLLRAESRRQPGQPGQHRQTGTHARTLLWWSSLSALAWAVTVSVILLWAERQIGVSWGGRSIELLQRTRHTSGFPFLDGLRRPDYRFPDLAHNWPALAVGLSYALAGVKYYQNLFAGVAPLAAGWRAGRLTRWAVGATVLMRAETVTAAVLTLPVVLVEPRWWPINTAIGQVLAAACNWAVLRFATGAFGAARDRGLSTVPRDDRGITGLSPFSGWVPTSMFYAAAACAIATLLYLGKLHDEWMYAVAVIAINLVLVYAIKCGARAGEVRVVLTRAVLAAERLRHLAGVRPAGSPSA